MNNHIKSWPLHAMLLTVLLPGCDPLLGFKIESKSNVESVTRECALPALVKLTDVNEWEYQNVESRTVFSCSRGLRDLDAYELYTLRHDGGMKSIVIQGTDSGGQSIEITDQRLGEYFKTGEKEQKANSVKQIYDSLQKSCNGLPPLSQVKAVCYSVGDCD